MERVQDKPNCSTCQTLKGDLWNEDDCVKCLPPLMGENEDAERIYFIVQNQYIMGFNGPISISQVAIHEAMKLYRIENRVDCFEKVLSLSLYFIEKINKKLNDKRQV